MARLSGVDLPKNKHMDRALTYIHGIGLTSARQILDKADLPYTMNSDDLSGDDVARIRKIIEDEYAVEGDRRREGLHGYQETYGSWMLSWEAASYGSSL